LEDSSSSSSCFGYGFGSWDLKDDMDVGAKREREGFGLNGFEREVFGSQENENNVWRFFIFYFYFFYGKARLNLG